MAKENKVLPETLEVITALRKIDAEKMKKLTTSERGIAFNDIMEELVQRFGITVRTKIELFDVFAAEKQRDFAKAVEAEKAKQDKNK